METQALEKKILQVNSVTELIKLIGHQEAGDIDFKTAVAHYMTVNRLKKSHVIRDAHVQRNYGYELLRGEKQPSRDKVISFCFGLRMSLQDAQQLLKISGYTPLNPKSKRDATILYAINRNIGVLELNIILDHQVLDTLDHLK